jgi:hypothetical protein
LLQQAVPVLQKPGVVQVGVQVAHPHHEPSEQVSEVQVEEPVKPSRCKYIQQQTQQRSMWVTVSC